MSLCAIRTAKENMDYRDIILAFFMPEGVLPVIEFAKRIIVFYSLINVRTMTK